MNKKIKIALTLSSVAVVLGLGAQFYTNYKIDQVLQNFPYHLRNQLSLNVTQQNKNFFNRELTFSITDAGLEKTDIITTKLTALPFAITAESELPPTLVRELNKKLKITIDKNVINSKFSVIGDYLQSSIATQFRDLTNKSQNLEIDLNFASKTKFMQIQSNLTGFNYDSNSNITGLTSNLTLTPVSHNQYDLADFKLKLANADIYLLNGENTNIQLKNTNYSVNKSTSAETYNLTTNLNNQAIYISNKNSRDDKTEISGLQMSTNLIGVPNSLVFANIFNALNKEQINYPEMAALLLDLLFNNQNFEHQIAIKKFNQPKNQQSIFSFNDAVMRVKANNQDKHNAELNIDWNLDQINFINRKENTPISLSGLSFNSNTTQIDLNNHLALIKQSINALPFDHERFFPAKDNKEFVTLLDNFIKNFRRQNHIRLKIKSFLYPEYIELKGLDVDYAEQPNEEAYNISLNAGIDQYTQLTDALQLDKIKLSLPVTVKKYQSLLPYYICHAYHLYSLACFTNLSNETHLKMFKHALRDLDLKIEGANVSANINTLPATQSAEVAADLTFSTLPLADSKQDEMQFLNSKLNHSNVNAVLSIPAILVDDNQQTAPIKAKGSFWTALKTWIKPLEQLSPYFIKDKDNYVSNFVKNGAATFINGKSPEQLEQEKQLEMERLERETERLEQEMEAQQSKDEVTELIENK